MRYAVKRYWELSDEVEVEASSVDEAIGRAHDLPLDESKGDYVPDSLNSDPEADVQPLNAETHPPHAPRITPTMRLVIIDLYGDGESLRVCEDTPSVDRIIAEFRDDGDSEEHFDEFMERKGVHLFITRLVSLEHLPNVIETNADSATRRSHG